MYKFMITYAYGGPVRGETQHSVEILGDCQENAIENFKKLYNYEIILMVEEIEN